MKKIYLLLFFFSISLNSTFAQVIINEVQSDAGNYENAGDWIELKNISATTVDISCWKLSNGGSLQIIMPQGVILDAGQYLLIGNKSKITCSSCDYKNLDNQFVFNPAGIGIGTGAYSNSLFLNTDPAVNGGCDCSFGSGAINNGNGFGDRLVLFDDMGNILDAIIFANGDFYGAGNINVNFAGTATCAPLANIVLPATNDIVYNGRKICNDLKGCNSSYARIPDGNNGAIVTWSQDGNLACTGCTNPCGVATNSASDDIPTPGLDNSSLKYISTLDGNPVNNINNAITVCGNNPLQFQFQIYNYTSVALTAYQTTGNLGSYVKVGNANPINFPITSFDPSTGITTLTYNIVPPLGTQSYEFVWGDAVTNCASCPGSNLTTIPNNNLSTEKECYIYRKITITRETPYGGTPVVSCSSPGSVTVSGVTGTNLIYTLQKQTVNAGPFNTIAGPQNSNSFAGIIDDDADPNLPNYQILVTTNNAICTNPPSIITPVPSACMGNPVCPQFVTTGPGMPTFTPANNTTVCAGSNLHFAVNITGVCNNNIVELMYDFDPLFDPYTQGTSLGTVTTNVGATPLPTTTGGKVFINEFVPRPSQGTCAGTPNGPNANSGEWIELYNAGPGNADIGGWSVSDGDWTAVIPAGTIILPNAYFLIGGGGTFCSSGILPDLNIETCNCTTVFPAAQDIMNLTDANEQIALYDCSGNFIDGVLWGGGQGLPDNTNNTALATGCGDYIIQKNVDLPVAVSFANSGGGFSGTNEGRYRTSSNTWVTFTYGNGTPKAANPTVYNGAVVSLGTSCPPPPVTADINVTLPDTCNQLSNVNITVKAIFKPQPVAPCLISDVVATANYTIPPCEMLTISGDGDYCDPASAPITVTTSSALMGNYNILLSNGNNNTNINPATGAGPFVTNVNNSGIWTITNVIPPIGTCAPKTQGSANVNIIPTPVITNAPINVNACFGYPYLLTIVEPLLNTNPFTSDFVWYDVPVGGSPINTLILPNAPITYYVAPTTGGATNCEGLRVPVNIDIEPLPLVPTVVCDGITAVFTQPMPNCIPAPCVGVQYSANGINWSNSNTYTAADPGWAGWGSPTNSTLYIRNINAPNCLNYTTFLNPCTNGALPAMLTQFHGLASGDKVQLFWKTLQERNVSHFEVERSRDKIHFEKIGNVNAVGNSDVPLDYLFDDNKPNNYVNFYRLKIVDIDFNYTYTHIIEINTLNTNNNITIYPNPAYDILYIESNALNVHNAQCSIIDLSGRNILNKEIKLSKGYNRNELNIQHLAKGNYIIKWQYNNNSYLHHFTKQ